MYVCHIYVGLPIAILYSLFASYLLLSYFQNKKKTNMFLFCIGVLHLSSLFIMPLLCFTIIYLPTKEIFLQYNEKVYSYVIDIISYVNHALNKLIYPIIKIYCQSGYISAKYKFTHISLKDWLLELNAFWLLLIGLIVYVILKQTSEEYIDLIESLLIYLNILDLISVYIEISYSIAYLPTYFFKTFILSDEYEDFILGKLSIYKQKKLESFKKHFKKLCQLNLTYIKDNSKFNCLSEIPTFIDKIKSEQYFEMEELGLIEPEILDESMTRQKLENIISEPYEKCKDYSRKLDRIKNIKEDISGQKDDEENKKCVYKLVKCCSSNKWKKIRFGLYILLCLIIIEHDLFIHASPFFKDINNDGYCNGTSEYEKLEQKEKMTLFSEIIQCFFTYPLFFILFIPTTGAFIVPLLYALINRRSITGNFLYAKNSSDTIDLVESLGKITEMIFPSLYLSSMVYVTLVYTLDKKVIFDIDCFTFFQVPDFKIIFYYKYILFFIFIVIMRYFESINLKCLKFKIHISDECYFDPKCIECCWNPNYKKRRQEYIDEGMGKVSNNGGELNQILISDNNRLIPPAYINNSNYNNNNNMNYNSMNNNTLLNNNYNNTYNNYNSNYNSNYNYPSQGNAPYYSIPLYNSTIN